jgi:hypothetical protein
MPYRTAEVLPTASLTWHRIICAKHLPEHGAEFNYATTMKVSIPMFWTLKPSGTFPYQTLNHNRYSVSATRTTLILRNGYLSKLSN